MVYKNGIKEYSLTTVLFGVPMGIVYGILTASFLVGLVSGILSGSLFSLLLFLFVKLQEKKFSKKRIEIARERKIVCDGAATINGNGGWMFLTEKGIEFYPHKINFSTKEIILPINMIAGANTHRNQIVIRIIDNSTIAVLVSHNKEWKKQIEATIANLPPQ